MALLEALVFHLYMFYSHSNPAQLTYHFLSFKPNCAYRYDLKIQISKSLSDVFYDYFRLNKQAEDDKNALEAEVERAGSMAQEKVRTLSYAFCLF